MIIGRMFLFALVGIANAVLGAGSGIRQIFKDWNKGY